MKYETFSFTSGEDKGKQLKFMLEKPSLPDELIISRLQEEYGFRVAKLTFLPIGAELEDSSLPRGHC